jgi:hypothetical protein
MIRFDHLTKNRTAAMRFQAFMLVSFSGIATLDHLMLFARLSRDMAYYRVKAAYMDCENGVQACYGVCGAYQIYTRDGVVTVANTTCVRPCRNVALARCVGLPDLLVGML